VDVTRLSARLPIPAKRLARHAVVLARMRGIRSTDALLVSYPKSGSTWLRFLLAHVLSGEESDFDSIRNVVPPIGRQRYAPGLLADEGRLLRAHEPMSVHARLAVPTVYLVRDGRDVALSYLAHERRYARFDGGVTTFLEQFLSGDVDSYGPWYEHVLGAFAFQREHPHSFLRVRYEDLRSDTTRELARIVAFLGVEPDDGMLDRVVAANTKDRMRAKESDSSFLGSMVTDGSPFVRPDERPGWSDLVPAPARARFERVCGPALVAAGYELGQALDAAVDDEA
jgi:hypothetical protein